MVLWNFDFDLPLENFRTIEKSIVLWKQKADGP